MKKRYLAFDLGAESGRAIVGLIEEGRLELDEIHRFPTQGLSVNGTLRWNVFRFLEEIVRGLKIYVEKYGPEVESIGVDTWGVDFGLIDKNGQLLSLPYHYRDAKNIGTDQILDSKFGNKNIYELTGVQFLPFNTLNQMCSLVKMDDASLKEAANILFIADLLHYFLTGKICCEYTVASISQLYNVRAGDWEDRIFDAFSVPKAIKTKVIDAGDTIGALLDELAEETGLRRGTPVIAPAVHDTASAAVAIPALDQDGWAYLSSGTWSVMGLELDEPVINPDSFAMSLSNSGGAFRKNLLLKNVMGLWIVQRCKHAWNHSNPGLGYAEIQSRAEAASEFEAIINVDDIRFLNPENMTQEIVKYLQETGQGTFDPSDVGTITRIVLESLALKYRFVLRNLARVAGQEVRTLHILGGGTKNTFLNQLTANATQLPVVTGPIEATAIGNIMMQAYGKGDYASLREIRQCVKESFGLQAYQPQDTEAWDLQYQQLIKLL